MKSAIDFIEHSMNERKIKFQLSHILLISIKIWKFKIESEEYLEDLIRIEMLYCKNKGE